jgi:hypothetical protein
MRPLQLIAASALATTWPLAGCGDTLFLSISTDGFISVFISTDGRPYSPWRIRVDGGPDQAIPSSGSLRLADLREGTHLVELMGLPPRCEVQGGNPRRVVVRANAETNVAFDVSCAG